MTQLTIIPNYQKKRLKCYGTVAAGEHVLVTVTGGNDWVAPDGENQTLRLRLLFGPHTVGVFPFVTEEMSEADSEAFPTPDEWNVDGDDPTCDLNLNTIQAAKYLTFGGNCLFVLDDPTNDILYATGEFEVLPWPKRRGADLPYDLDGYPDFVFTAKKAMEDAAADAQTAANAASAAEATATRLEQDVYGHRQAAEAAATNAQNSASAASNSATEAKGWANGGTDGDTPTATNNAKYYAGQAGGAKTDAAASATSAETSSASAEAWATGGTGGTPSATNNAKYYAEQAADSAQDAEEALEDKADKVGSATNGNFAGLDSNGNLTDSGNKAADFAPATDIAKTALASDVQTSLGKADSAVQPSDILSDNKIKTALLPSFVDDVLEFSALANFPATGETGKIYVAKDTNKTYRWSGSSYVEISASLALGETSSTAYRGDKGKTAYDHATDSNRLTTAKNSGLYKIATTAEGHVKSVTAVEKSDITALGIPAQDTTYTLPPATASTLGGVKVGNNLSIDANGVLSSPVSVDASLTTQGAAADAKAVGDALRSGFTEWEFSGVPSGYTIKRVRYETSTPVGARWVVSYNESDVLVIADQGSTSATELTFLDSEVTGMTATRSLITPTKTSQLTNDGDGTNAFVKTNDARLSDARTPTAHTHAIADVTGLGAAIAQKADTADLPYRLVTPGEWEFSGLPSGMTAVIERYDGDLYWSFEYEYNGASDSVHIDDEGGDALTLSFEVLGNTVTATRPSLPGHLLDRAGNRVEVTGDTTFTLPAANPGYLRDFLVRLEISGSTVPTITFAAPTGETITYETDGDDFPVPDEAGDWLYSFTESCVAHTFAVALKKVNEVAQGGS